MSSSDLLFNTTKHVWSITPNLYLGDIEAAKSLKLLNDLKITHIVNAAYEIKNYHEVDRTMKWIASQHEADLKYFNLRWKDDEDQKFTHIDEALEFITQAIKADEKVLVHCYKAQSRSPSIIIAYLISRGLSLEDALKKVRAARDHEADCNRSGLSNIQPSRNFINQLKALQIAVAKDTDKDTKDKDTSTTDKDTEDKNTSVVEKDTSK